MIETYNTRHHFPCLLNHDFRYSQSHVVFNEGKVIRPRTRPQRITKIFNPHEEIPATSQMKKLTIDAEISK